MSGYTKNILDEKIIFLSKNIRFGKDKLEKCTSFIKELPKNEYDELMEIYKNYIRYNDQYEFIEDRTYKDWFFLLPEDDKINLMILIPDIAIKLYDLGLDIDNLPNEIKECISRKSYSKSARN